MIKFLVTLCYREEPSVVLRLCGNAAVADPVVAVFSAVEDGFEQMFTAVANVYKSRQKM